MINSGINSSSLLVAVLLTTSIFYLGIVKEIPTVKALEIRNMLNPEFEWSSDNRDKLDCFIAENAWNPGDSKPKPVAVFDWDNTIIKNDIGDYFFLWMLRNDRILQVPQRNWKRSNRYLTDSAVARLVEITSAYEPGQALRTSIDIACAAEFISIYTSGKIMSGEAAFAGYNYQTIEPSYAWASQLLAGYRPDEIRNFAESAINEALVAPVGQKIDMAGFKLDGWVRVYAQIKDLIDQLQEHGFDVWVVSASNQYIIEVFARQVGIRPERIIGVRPLLNSEGIITSDLRGCGPIAEGENSLITYRLGKRCWINTEIFGASADVALQKNPDSAKRQLFAAGDSDTDMPFVADAAGLHLVINRNKPELMCNALNNADGHWLINPMFIEPLPKREDPYPCSCTACILHEGTLSPCRLDDGSIIEDQSE